MDSSSSNSSTITVVSGSPVSHHGIPPTLELQQDEQRLFNGIQNLERGLYHGLPCQLSDGEYES